MDVHVELMTCFYRRILSAPRRAVERWAADACAAAVLPAVKSLAPFRFTGDAAQRVLIREEANTSQLKPSMEPAAPAAAGTAGHRVAKNAPNSAFGGLCDLCF